MTKTMESFKKNLTTKSVLKEIIDNFDKEKDYEELANEYFQDSIDFSGVIGGEYFQDIHITEIAFDAVFIADGFDMLGTLSCKEAVEMVEKWVLIHYIKSKEIGGIL